MSLGITNPSMMTTAQIKELLYSHLTAVTAEIKDTVGMNSLINLYNKKDSRQATEAYASAAFFGQAQPQSEGGAAALDSMKMGPTTYITNFYLSLGYQITDAAIEDDLYKEETVSKLGDQLLMAYNRAVEYLLATPFNAAFTTATGQVGADGKSLVAFDHPLIKGSQTYSNRYADAQPCQAAFEGIHTMVGSTRDDAGNVYQLMTKRLVGPLNMGPIFEQLIKSYYTPENANNSINPIASMNMFQDGYIATPYLLNSKSWFVETDSLDGLIYQVRKKPEAEVERVEGLAATRTILRARQGAGWTGARRIFGSAGQ